MHDQSLAHCNSPTPHGTGDNGAGPANGKDTIHRHPEEIVEQTPPTASGGSSQRTSQVI
jgi:hypothetical protein